MPVQEYTTFNDHQLNSIDQSVNPEYALVTVPHEDQDITYRFSLNDVKTITGLGDNIHLVTMRQGVSILIDGTTVTLAVQDE